MFKTEDSYHDHLDISGNFDANLMDKTYGSSSSANNAASSSKAVLAALRALQDKIRRLESERSQALDESTQLRHQLKNLEIEAEHTKQREQLSSQKNLQEVKSAYERLLNEKAELEIRLARIEEKNKIALSSADSLQTRIRTLEDEKHSSVLKIKELEHQHHQLEMQIKQAQQKEEGIIIILAFYYFVYYYYFFN